MPLPETNRVFYARNPLTEVTAHLRFPPILRIEAEVPAQFQEVIRGRYPIYRQTVPTGQLPAQLPPQLRNLIQSMGAAAGPVQQVFETQDRKSSVTLARDSLTLRTTDYTKWEAYRTQLETVRAAFEQIYRPASYSRLGLRYVDVIRRSTLGLNGISWSELLNPAIGGELSVPEFGETVDSAQRQLHCSLPGDDCYLWLRTGIPPQQANQSPPRERCFLIDCDFHTHASTEINNVTNKLDIFNRASGNLFRWAIRDRLRDALQPQPLD